MPGLGGEGGGFCQADRRHRASAVGPLPPWPTARVRRCFLGSVGASLGSARLRSLLLAFPLGSSLPRPKLLHAGCFLEVPVRGYAPLDVHKRECTRVCGARSCHAPIPAARPRGGYGWGEPRSGGGVCACLCASKANCKAQGKTSKASRQRQQQHNCITVIVSALSVSQASKIVQKMSCAQVPPVSSTCTPSLGA